MYLSSRSVGQANITRDYINTLVQGRHRMPVGPVIISPHGLLPSLYRWVVRGPSAFRALLHTLSWKGMPYGSLMCITGLWGGLSITSELICPIVSELFSCLVSMGNGKLAFWTHMSGKLKGAHLRLNKKVTCFIALVTGN
eukprot:scaffold103760_cov15-Tisochrysis_lutea.AAC.1